MKKKLLILLLAFTLLATFVFASGKKEKTTAATAPGEPQYGGTVTLMRINAEKDPEGFDMYHGVGPTVTQFTNLYLENLIIGDVEGLGPRGTNEFAFQNNSYPPQEYWKGQLAESWEISTDPMGITFHIRKGVMWTGNPNIGMEPREFTAYDVALSQNQMNTRAGYEKQWNFIDSIVASDKYTVFYKFNRWEPNWGYFIGWGHYATMMCPEVEECADPGLWSNASGTGPFMISDYVGGSYGKFKKNPDWWNKKRIIDGKEYDLPFVDNVMLPIVPDESTQIAALRTGKADIMPVVPLVYEKSLSNTSPGLIGSRYSAGNNSLVFFNCRDGGTFSDKAVRRALTVAVDQQAICNNVFIDGVVHSMPIAPSVAAFTPMEELPESTKLLFSYNPELAKQMLADAGYPDGFETELIIQSGYAWMEDASALLADYWSAIGVTLNINVQTRAVALNARNLRTYDAMLDGDAPNQPYKPLMYACDQTNPRCNFGDDYSYGEYLKVLKTMDTAESTKIQKDLAVYLLDSAYAINCGNANQMIYYWTWVKNYYGETDAGYRNFTPMLSSLWIDQDLKAEMGY